MVLLQRWLLSKVSLYNIQLGPLQQTTTAYFVKDRQQAGGGGEGGGKCMVNAPVTFAKIEIL